MDSSASPPARAALSVAVVGAGSAGLVAARELRREGHRVVVFERGPGVGGVWVYTSAVESDPLGLDRGRQIVHSSLYASLRLILPREIMGFLDYPFVPSNDSGRDARRFPGHPEVRKYLEDFARHFDLYGLIRFEMEVVKAEMDGATRWAVTSRDAAGGEVREIYDAVVVCVGNYWQPRIAEIPGINTWPGDQIHSHNYRLPEPYKDKVVVVIGFSVSAVDIARDVSEFAKEVYIAIRSAPKLPGNLIRLGPDGAPTKQPGYDNIWTRSMIKTAHEDGTLEFQDGGSVLANAIIHCTGYCYHYPFLETNGIVSVHDNRVGPLYKHIFPPSLAPSLSFIGIPKKIIPFPTYELQSKWVAAVLSGRLALPSQEEMMEEVEAFYSELEASGIPRRYTHEVPILENYRYPNMLAAEVGHPGFEEWRRQMAVSLARNRTLFRPKNYHDEWNDDVLVGQAQDDFRRLGFGSV